YDCEARGNLTQYHLIHVNAMYGIQFNGGTTDSLLVDNANDSSNAAYMVQDRAAGDVIAYNSTMFAWGSGYPANDMLEMGISFHGGNTNMNLVEGNVV